MSKIRFEYSPRTNTVRLMPYNYCCLRDVATDTHHYWVLDFDAGADLQTLLYAATVLHQTVGLRFRCGVTVVNQLNEGLANV